MAVGRPRAFDIDEALAQALRVFWQKGYEGASLADLTAAMGINPPSLYAAFGNKEGLFRQALDRYVEGPGGYHREALEAPRAREVFELLLRGAADLAGDPSHPAGCLMVQGALACGDAADSVRQELVARRTAGEAAIRLRFERARQEGDLPDDIEPAALARYVTTILYGMAVQAVGGAGRKELQAVVETALRSWPVVEKGAGGRTRAAEPKRTERAAPKPRVKALRVRA